MSTPQRTAHYVVSTHWDREWYESFQNYRFRLVNMLDEVLDTLRGDPEFRYFVLDGQSIPIEDYLEIRPEREPDVREFAEAGRLRLGPWYVLPDEFLVSGESLIRNLQMGLKLASRFGRPSRAGFICDCFGHISQLPQIFRGFRIDNAFLWRGVNESTHGAVFRWQAPEGSEVIAYRFNPQRGYCAYAIDIRLALEHDAPFVLDTAVKALCQFTQFEAKRCPTPSFLLFDGGDHMEIEPQTSDLHRRANKKLRDIEIVHSHLDGFVEDLREQREHITRTFVGELRDPAQMDDGTWLIPGVLSSRIHLKQANARCESELCHWAEPLSTFASGLGMAYPTQYLEVAWRHLLQNHPHDSICGCSIDPVHKDMEYRFDQSLGIASHVARDAMQHIAHRVRVPDLGENDIALVLFNPSCEPSEEPVDITLRFPASIDATYQEWPTLEPKIGFRLYDADGEEVPYQYVRHHFNRKGFRRPLRKLPLEEIRHEVDIAAGVKIPAYGYTTLVCRPIKEATRHLGTMAVDDHTIENAHLRVSVNPNGSLQLTDKKTGQTYEGLLTLEDGVDIGDGWYHAKDICDQVYSSAASSADVALIADGIAKATLMIRITMQIPEEFRFDHMVRSESRRPLVVTHHVTLRQNSDAVEVRTLVENTVRDHRLRVLFPTGARASTYLADQAFDVIERPIALRADNERYKELEVETKPQQTWTAVHDDKRGLAILSTGLPESAVRDLPDRPIALTLLRSFLKAVMTSGNQGGQIQGPQAFDYRIVPLGGSPDVARLTRAGQRLAAGIRTVALERTDLALHDVAHAPEARDLPPRHSFLELASADAVITAIQRCGDRQAVTVRLFNPSERNIDVTIAFRDITSKDKTGASKNTARRARTVDFEGRAGDPLTTDKAGTHARLKPKQISTIQWSELIPA